MISRVGGTPLPLFMRLEKMCMIKECPIVINNDVVTVVKYGDVEVQFPSIHKSVAKVFVNNENGKYSIIDNAKMREMQSIQPIISEKRSRRKNRKRAQNNDE